jgi:hypothetical protein
MHPELSTFLKTFAGVVVMTLAPVILIAFVSIPVSLGHHPGEASSAQASAMHSHRR